jgi:NAD-dependent dihydropyrimidine dehydrogenase PreA subunit
LAKITVDLAKCNGDGVCVDVCPVELYELQELADFPGEQKSVPVRPYDCILCMACVASCPTGAITVEEE